MTLAERRIFLDTSADIARFFKRDGKHGSACEIWEIIRQSGFDLVTTNHVLDDWLPCLGGGRILDMPPTDWNGFTIPMW